MLDDELKQTIQQAYRQLITERNLLPRHGQRVMIAEIAKSLSKSGGVGEKGERICVVEAGTGTGKTMAYLVAAIPVAQALGKNLVIATGTVGLQEQIVYKDIPAVLEDSGLEFTASLAKGRGRYLGFLVKRHRWR